MSHLMRNAKSNRATGTESAAHKGRPSSPPDSPPAPGNCAREWWDLAPPPFSIREILRDLIDVWRDSFSGAPLRQKLAYAGLRILQNVAYHMGYGTDSLLAEIPLPRHPNFHIMEKNLEDILPPIREDWLFGFLALLNHPDKATVPLPTSVIPWRSRNHHERVCGYLRLRATPRCRVRYPCFVGCLHPRDHGHHPARVRLRWNGRQAGTYR